MKKLFLTISLVISVFAMLAQRITVTEFPSGEAVESGASFYIYGDGSESWGEPGGELLKEFKITANADIALIAAREGEAIPGTQNTICLDLCYSHTVSVTNPVSIAAGGWKVFSGHYLADDYTQVLGQEQHLTYYLYEEGAPSDRFVINVTFKYSLDGIDDYSNTDVFSNPYPMPARDVVNFDYNFATNVVSEVAIFNMMGQEVMRSEINGTQGRASINVSDLADGIYFYSLIINGKTEKSNKLIVRK